MKHIVIISASVRKGRLSHRIALFLQKYIIAKGRATVEVLDLKAYNFPLFEERLAYQENPSPAVLDFADRFRRADGVILVSPVYNSSFPAALKNVIDLFVEEWADKVVAVASVTYGTTPGIATVMQLQALLLRLGALISPASYTAIEAGTTFDEEGNAIEPENTNRRVAGFVDKLFRLLGKD